MSRRDVRAEISRIARERILVLDGAWGTMLHGAGLQPEDYRGERFADHPVDAHRRPRPPQPDPARPRRLDPRALPRRRRRHHDDEHLHGHLDRPGRLRPRGRRLRDEPRRARGSRARPPATASSPARSGRSTSRSRSARRSTTPASARTASTRSRTPTPSRSRALAEGGVDLLLLETIFDTLNAKAAIARRARGGARAAALDLGDDRRPLRADALRADDRGVLDLGRARRAADRRRQLLARRARDAPLPRRARRASRPASSAPTRTPGSRTPSAATTRRPR